jgi:two-component system alkaline phosphatase synthesis response regulator PhoP
MAKILIADDERDIRDLVAFTLKIAGHEVITTTNGEEAYETAIQIIPDLILLDVRMPRMTGYEACERIKANPDTQNIPVVFLSAKGQENEVMTGISVGASDYILKPFSLDQLTSKVKSILDENQRG